MIVVSLEDRKLALVEDGQVKKVYTVAVGKPSTPSPVGTFTIERRVANPTYHHNGKTVLPGPGNPVGTRWMGLSIQRLRNPRNQRARSIGKAASHGCIRMAKADLEEFYELVAVGDTVELVGERNEETAQLFGDGQNPAAGCCAAGPDGLATPARRLRQLRSRRQHRRRTPCIWRVATAGRTALRRHGNESADGSNEWFGSGAAAGGGGAAAGGVDVRRTGPAAAGSTAGNQEDEIGAQPQAKEEKENDRIEDVVDGRGSAVAGCRVWQFHCMDLAAHSMRAPQSRRETEMSRTREPKRLPGAVRLALALAACLPLLVAASIVVVPSGMGGVRVSQIGGTLPGTLYPGVHFITPLVESVRPSTCAITCSRRAWRKRARRPAAQKNGLSVQSREGLNIGLGGHGSLSPRSQQAGQRAGAYAAARGQGAGAAGGGQRLA